MLPDPNLTMPVLTVVLPYGTTKLVPLQSGRIPKFKLLNNNMTLPFKLPAYTLEPVCPAVVVFKGAVAGVKLPANKLIFLVTRIWLM